MALQPHTPENLGSPGMPHGGPRGVVRSGMTEAWVSRHVEGAPLAETSDGEDPIAPVISADSAVGTARLRRWRSC